MKCKVCGKESNISSFLGVCRDCILEKWEKAKKFVERAHKKAREMFGLPPFPPRERNGIECKVCGNECKIGEGGIGYCGLVKNVDGKLVRFAGTKDVGLLEWYYDPHPTNCVAINFCPAGTGCGYPKFAYSNKAEYGYYNLAVFYGACNFNCLFCQNWHFKILTKNKKPLVSSDELVRASLRKDVSCVCFFGGTPEPQMLHMLNTAKKIREANKNRILRICAETNGNANKSLLKKFAEISFESGGCIKFDLKTFDERLNIALTGISNKKTFENFEFLANNFGKREIPFLYASTLLVPHYITLEEIEKIAEFIASIDENIPYILLAFYPSYHFTDVGFTKKEFALKCLEICKKKGLKNVEIGNKHLLA